MRSKFTLSRRIAMLVGFVVAVFFVLIGWVFNQFATAMHREKQVATQHVVETVHAVLAHYAAMTKAGPDGRALTPAEAQRRAIDTIKQLRYAEGDYFWINDLEPRMVMHPTNKALDGQSLRENADPNGKHLFVEMVEVCKRQGAGFVEYSWPKPGHEQPQPKVSYVKLFEPWGWIVGSGIYVDDVQRQLTASMLRFAGATFLALVVIAGIGTWAMKSTMRPLIEALVLFRAGAHQVSSASEQVSNSAQSLARGASAQGGSLEETSSALARAGGDARRNAEDAANVASLMTDLDARMRASGTLLADLTNAMDGISDSSAKVSKIIRTIDEIAFQTNILALNAAVEAARAGEAGAGFAVVADEVRALAQRAAAAARETGGLIEASLACAHSGDSTAQRVTQTILGFADTVGAARGIATRVNDTSQAQLTQFERISVGVGQIESVTQQVAATAEENAAASEELQAQAVTVESAVDALVSIVGTLPDTAVTPAFGPGTSLPRVRQRDAA